MANIKPLAVKSLRVRLGWTQEQIGWLLIIHEKTYGKIEQGRKPSLGNVTAPVGCMRTVLLDALTDVVNAGRGGLIPRPGKDVESLEETWRTLLNLAAEVRRG